MPTNHQSSDLKMFSMDSEFCDMLTKTMTNTKAMTETMTKTKIKTKTKTKT